MAENTENKTFTPVPVPAMDLYVDQPIEKAGYWGQLCEHVLRAEIETHKNMEDAISLDKMLQIAITKAEENRKFLVGPLNAHVTAINLRFKPHTTDMKDARGILQDKIKVYRDAEREKALAAAEKERVAREEAAMKEAEELEEAGQVEEATEVLDEAVDGPAPAPVPSGPVRGDMGGVASFVPVWKWEVTDLAKVPKIYLMVDEKKVNESVKKDKVRDIPGLRIWDEERMVNR